jgi:hypothetical protein
MSNEQINIAIAEACGWKSIGRAWDSIRTIIIQDAWESPSGEIRTLRNYCNDLNAMHEAEKVLTRDQIEVFCEQLLPKHHVIWWGIHTTARQRAEAFLRTIGKWGEEK